FVTKKKVFDLDWENEKFLLVPSNIVPVKGSGKILVMGSYFNKGDNVAKDHSKGLAIYEMDGQGNVLSKTYNSCALDVGRHLPSTTKGKIDKVGSLYIHKMIQAPGGKMFAVGEGYKRKASAGGIALTALNAASGGYNGHVGVTKIVTTDLVVMEFNDKYKLTNATIYEKRDNDAEISAI